MEGKGGKCVEGAWRRVSGKQCSALHVQPEICCRIQPGVNPDATREIKAADGR